MGGGNVNRETEHDLLQGTLAGKEYKMKKHITDEKTGISYTSVSYTHLTLPTIA